MSKLLSPHQPRKAVTITSSLLNDPKPKDPPMERPDIEQITYSITLVATRDGWPLKHMIRAHDWEVTRDGVLVFTDRTADEDSVHVAAFAAGQWINVQEMPQDEQVPPRTTVYPRDLAEETLGRIFSTNNPEEAIPFVLAWVEEKFRAEFR